MPVLTRFVGMLVVAQVGANPIAPGVATGGPADIAFGVRSCLAATNAETVKTDGLAGDGWNAVSITKDGRPALTQLRMFSRNGVTMMIDEDPRALICFVTAKLPDPDAFDDVALAINRETGAPPKVKDGESNRFYFLPDHHIVQLDRTRTATSPAIRVAIGWRR